MQNDVILYSLDDCIEESRWLKKGDLIIEFFDHTGQLYPLKVGNKYKVDLELSQLDFEEPKIIYNTEGKIEQINETFAHYLYGYVENNIFHVGEFKFNFSEYNDYAQYEGKYLKFKADRINVDFLKELP